MDTRSLPSPLPLLSLPPCATATLPAALFARSGRQDFNETVSALLFCSTSPLSSPSTPLLQAHAYAVRQSMRAHPGDGHPGTALSLGYLSHPDPSDLTKLFPNLL